MRRDETRPPSAPTNGDSGREGVPEVLSVARSGAVTTLVLAGELDLGTAPAVRAVLEDEVARRPARVILDVAAVEFVDSSGLQALVQTHRALSTLGGALELTRVPEELRRLLEITGLAGLLTRSQPDAA